MVGLWQGQAYELVRIAKINALFPPYPPVSHPSQRRSVHAWTVQCQPALPPPRPWPPGVREVSLTLREDDDGVSARVQRGRRFLDALDRSFSNEPSQGPSGTIQHVSHDEVVCSPRTFQASSRRRGDAVDPFSGARQQLWLLAYVPPGGEANVDKSHGSRQALLLINCSFFVSGAAAFYPLLRELFAKKKSMPAL